MPSKKAAQRNHAVAKRAARLYRDGLSLTQISEATEIPREHVKTRIELGQRLLQLEETP